MSKLCLLAPSPSGGICAVGACTGVLDALLARVQQKLLRGRLLFTDGKAYEVSCFTTDPDAANGWGRGTHGCGCGWAQNW